MKCQRNKFMLSRKEAYLNCAYMSPLLKKVENAGKQGISLKRRPNKISANDFFRDTDKIRHHFSELINCDQHDRIVTIPSVSYAMANITHNIKITKGENIVVAGDQFPSNIYPWMRLCDETGATLKIISSPDTLQNRGLKWNSEILSSIDKNTRLVAISHVHWADGTFFDLVNMRRITKEIGALLVIDGTQSVGALPFDVKEINPDALVCAAYKWLLGPYSIGLAYFGKAFDVGIPIEENWINRHNSEDFANLVNYNKDYRKGALRYEVGEHSNFILTPMLLASIKQIKQWGPENIQAYCRKLISEPIVELRNLGLFIEKDDQRSAHLFGVKISSERQEALKKSFKKNRVNVSFRGDFVRVSPNVYNDEMDMKRFVNSFKQIF